MLRVYGIIACHWQRQCMWMAKWAGDLPIIAVHIDMLHEIKQNRQGCKKTVQEEFWQRCQQLKKKIHIIARRRASWLVGVHEVILKYLLDHYWLVSVHIQEEESGCVTITNRIAKYQVMIIDRLQNALINWPSICVDVHQHQPDTYTSLWCIRARSMTPLICPTVLFKSQTLRTPCDHHKSTTHT